MIEGEQSQMSIDEPADAHEADPDVEMGDGETPAPSEQDKGHKRSTSVLSQTSQASTKRSRK